MVSSNNAINNTVGASISGVTNTLTVTNGSNTASSAARSTITVGGASSADPTLNFNVSGVTDFEMGIDNNDSDSFKLAASTALGTTDTFVMTTSGERTLPLQPAFLGVLSANDLNVTGDGSTYYLGSGNPLTIQFDRGSNFTTAGVFTAPVTGIYCFMGWIDFINTTTAHNAASYRIETTAGTYLMAAFNPNNIKNNGGGTGFSVSYLTSMTAGNTARWRGIVSAGAKTVDVRSTSYFAGWLVS